MDTTHFHLLGTVLVFSSIALGQPPHDTTTDKNSRNRRRMTSPVSVDILIVGAGQRLGRGGERLDMTKQKANSLNRASKETRKALESFLSDPEYVKKGLTELTFMKRIVVDPMAQPYSNALTGTITINNRYNDPKERLLTLFIHEQMHGFLFQEKVVPRLEGAIAEFRRLGLFEGIPLPEFLKNAPDKGRSEMESHMVVNWLELNLGARFLGRAVSEKMFREDRIYPELNKRILEKESQIKEILLREDLIPLNEQ